MSDLKSFVTLQARLFAFLERQDEATLQAIASGSAQLAVVGADAAPPPPPAPKPVTPSSNPLQVAQDLTKLPSGDERRLYLNSAKLAVKGLREVARSIGMRGYSKLAKDDLIALLANHGPDRTEASAEAPVDHSPKIEVPEKVEGPGSDVEVVAIAAHLRDLETEEAGAAYLDDQHLDRDALLAVAAELQLTRVTRLSQTELEKRVLKQAIGARRKFAGLRKW
ncbi:hypothetical protein QRX60_18010 [Amycolatopsis mongoliensis]|uniref:Rho termination factor N-terminal domain-containing protein n=1 Tax=Amycolatopsis mongoliensis TaxID=715475 RepID=A0A9Y2JX98_9PSEU|nr:hypothetical protein [Amycolatopsis sp. 4-36]WIY05650.1 hypothetical protein QRX60_18010 [Amycolatopsis sp. 4-36]